MYLPTVADIKTARRAAYRLLNLNPAHLVANLPQPYRTKDVTYILLLHEVHHLCEGIADTVRELKFHVENDLIPLRIDANLGQVVKVAGRPAACATRLTRLLYEEARTKLSVMPPWAKAWKSLRQELAPALASFVSGIDLVRYGGSTKRYYESADFEVVLEEATQGALFGTPVDLPYGPEDETVVEWERFLPVRTILSRHAPALANAVSTSDLPESLFKLGRSTFAESNAELDLEFGGIIHLMQRREGAEQSNPPSQSPLDQGSTVPKRRGANPGPRADSKAKIRKAEELLAKGLSWKEVASGIAKDLKCICTAGSIRKLMSRWGA